MLQHLLIAYLTLAVSCGPLLCCCTFRAVASGKACCTATAQPCPNDHGARGGRHHCSGHKHHDNDAHPVGSSASQSINKHSRSGRSPHDCPCRKPHERKLLAIPTGDTVGSAAAVDATGQQLCWFLWPHTGEGTFLRRPLPMRAFSLPARFESGREMLRAYGILRC
jgi:hypothetical protein